VTTATPMYAGVLRSSARYSGEYSGIVDIAFDTTMLRLTTAHFISRIALLNLDDSRSR
jgi:hypothetical protein